MSGWKRLYPKPAGSLPGGIVTQWGVALITVVVLLVFGMWLASGGGETALETAVEDVAAPARDFAGSMAAQVEAEAMRAETRRSAAERALQAQQRQEALEAGSAIGAGQVTVDEARLPAPIHRSPAGPRSGGTRASLASECCGTARSNWARSFSRKSSGTRCRWT